jgi:adenine-specific DNA-methyltransferase
LRRELDFFIKSECLLLDELLAQDENLTHQHILRARVVRDIGHQIIDFLAQVEDFQKRLFEKKKFVIRTEYCITIDRVPEALWGEVLQNEAQRAEWRELYGVNPQPTEEFLRQHPTLVVDTRHFSEDFKWHLLAHFDDLDEALDGVLIKSENFQALNLLLEKYRGKVKCIYIDPPYNTGSDEFIYKDRYQHSSWLSMMMDRMLLAKEAMAQDAFIYVSIDDRELDRLRLLLLSVFSESNKVAQVVVKVKDPAGVGQQSIIFDITEYGLVFAKNIEDARLYAEGHPMYELKEITEPLRGYRHWIVSYGEKRLIKQIERPGVGVIKVYEWTNYQIKDAENIDFYDFISNAENIYADYNPSGGMILAIRDELPERGLSSIEYVPLRGRSAGQVTMIYFLNRRILARASDVIMVQGKKAYRRSVLTNLWEAPNAALHTEGRVGLTSGKKPEALLLKIISAFSNEGSIVLDFFLGSGTSAAVAHKAKRRWLGIEEDDSVFQIALKRMKLVIYGENSGVSRQLKWTGGGYFKYLYLEQYEDTLNNLELPREREGQLALERFGDEYLLRYMLDFETQGSPSLINLEQFQDPFAYKLKVQEGDEIQERVVDLVETFNYLLGIHVKKMRQFQDNGRLYRAVLGEKDGKRIVIVWRPLVGLNGNKTALRRDQRFIEGTVLPTLLGEGKKPDRLLVNGICYVPDAEPIEPEFKRLMMGGTEAQA